ncbi:hypothetical protein [Methanobrevibacter sp. V74]|uniref:hypothetical protein n=1 Tax=Methanobrevibacter sp. V74 TaxID=3064279 RepID=UPI002735445A|nr:hypothetical protein [Methanobrevibacter sp. V74]
MRKEAIKLSIDKEVLDIARQEMPNISRFTEECMRKYLGIGITLTPLYKQQELLETIGKCHLELHLMNELEHIEEMKREMELEKINYAWRSVFTHYRDTGRINEELLQHAMKVLDIDRKDLIDIIELTYTYFRRDRIDTTDWQKVYEKYGN